MGSLRWVRVRVRVRNFALGLGFLVLLGCGSADLPALEYPPTYPKRAH
jgi:hypothetical protein